MTTLEQLVPPFELCRKIPADSFNGTALVWKTYHRGIISDNPYVAERDTWDHEFREDAEQPIIPAPTVQEILEAMPESKTTEAGVQRRHGGYYCYMCKISADIDIGELNCKSGNNLPEALLKLWLDVIRVEREAKNAKHEAT